jgi:RimJ/RimL family protein N-acetyltransferase
VTILHAKTVRLVLMSRHEVQTMIDTMPPEQRAELSAAWLAQLEASGSPDPWVHGFSIVLAASGETLGSCVFKGPPDADGAVEIAYGVHTDRQGNGYATEAAIALTAFALGDPQVTVVRAHTLPTSAASARVLTKAGFIHVGEVVDPDDGLVWRWEHGR